MGGLETGETRQQEKKGMRGEGKRRMGVRRLGKVGERGDRAGEVVKGGLGAGRGAGGGDRRLSAPCWGRQVGPPPASLLPGMPGMGNRSLSGARHSAPSTSEFSGKGFLVPLEQDNPGS